MAAITTDKEVQEAVGELAAGTGGTTSVQQVNPVLQNVDPTTGQISIPQDEKLTGPANLTSQPGGTTGAAASQGDTSNLSPTAPVASKTDLGQVAAIEDVTTKVDAVGPMTAAQIGTAPTVDMTGVQGTVSAGSIGTAATQQLDQKATTQYQLSQLMSSIQQGQPLPPWASPAVRKISGVMQARGLGASSMAAAAMTQAVMEAGVVIAADDAKKYATIQLANLNNEQQMALSNAATYAAMDKANLNARLTAAVTNAQSLLATETKNLDAQQQANTLSFNALTQAAFKDAAEENARKQFNAKNEVQVEEFFAQLGSQVESANANRVAAMEQFNVSESNAMSQFNNTMRDSREKFNSNMQFAVDQSNVQWRRQVNTANTAIQNETNRINVQNEFNASQNALNNLWQQYRDNAAWNFQKGESKLQRDHELGVMAMEFANTTSMYDKKQKDDLAMGIGNWLATWAAS